MPLTDAQTEFFERQVLLAAGEYRCYTFTKDVD